MNIELRIPYPNELYHHGIEGMKWGITNGPPYPIEPGDHSAAEKKANPKLALKVGEKRMQNRKRFLAKRIDKDQSSLSLRKQLNTTQYGTLRRQTKETLEDAARLAAIGKRTIAQRAGIISAGTIATGMSIVLASSTVPWVALTAAIPVGMSIVGYHKSTR